MSPQEPAPSPVHEDDTVRRTRAGARQASSTRARNQAAREQQDLEDAERVLGIIARQILYT